VGALESNLGNLTGNVGALESNLGNLTGNVGALESNLGNLTGNVGALESNLGNLTGNVGALESNLGNITTNDITFNGNVTHTKTTNLNQFSEALSTQTNIGSNNITIDYLDSATHYISGQTLTNGPLTLNVSNIPNITDTTRTYLFTTLLDATTSTNGNNYVSAVNVSANNVSYESTTLRFSTDTETIESEITDASFVLQQFAYIYLGASSSNVFTNVSKYK
jgi:hypothetical protein